MRLSGTPIVRYRRIKLRAYEAREGNSPKEGLLCEERTDAGWQRIALILDLPCDSAQAARLARACTLRQLPPDRALEAAARLLE